MPEATAVTSVVVHSSDPIVRLGAASILEADSRLTVLTGGDLAPADVIVMLEPSLGQDVFPFLREVRALSRPESTPRCVLVTDQVRPEMLMTAIECGLVALLRLHETSGEELLRTVLAVSEGEAHLPPPVQGSLLSRLDRLRREVLEPNGLTLFGPSERERDVLRLLAEGYRTEEIASKLAYSAGTVKNILNAVMARHGLRSRAHAVAFAVRTAAI